MLLDINMAVLHGILASDAEPMSLEGGVRTIRFLVMVRTEVPVRRIDVVPVAMWDPPDELWWEPGERDDPIWVVGAIQRTPVDSPDEGASRLEVVAEKVLVGDLGERWPVRL